MASTHDARAGWEIYRNSSFSLSLDEINDRLERAGYVPVAPRTYTHYERLRRRGFTRYVTINRLDTMDIHDPFLDESIRSRYAISDAHVPAQLIVQTEGTAVEIMGIADSLSEHGAELVVTDGDQMEALRSSPPEPGASVTLHFLDPPATTYGTVDYAGVLDPALVRIGVVFRRLVPVSSFTGARPVGTSLFQLTVGTDQAQPALDDVYRDLYWLMQAVESARGLANLCLEALGDGRAIIGPPTVERLTVASPLDAWLRFGVQVYLLLETVSHRLEAWRKPIEQVVDVIVKRETIQADAELTRASADIARAQAEHIREETQGLRLENRRKELGLRVVEVVVEQAVEALSNEGHSVDPSALLPGERALRMADDLVQVIGELDRRGFEIAPRAEGDRG